MHEPPGMATALRLAEREAVAVRDGERLGDRAEQAAAMAAANARNVELQKALQQLQVRLNSSQF